MAQGAFNGLGELFNLGRILLKEASDRVIRCSMELGGNAPFVVLDDANIDEAVKGLMLAKMRNGGAACTAANRIYVHKNIAAEFTKKFSSAMSALVMGRGRDAGIHLGASVSINERDKIAELVNESIASGGKIIVGGTLPGGPGAFYPATVISVDKTNDILNHEVFGPVAPIVTFSFKKSFFF